MHRRRTLLVAALLGLAAPTVIGSSPASAVDQDLVASVAAGPPGTEIELTSASCVNEGDPMGEGPFVARILRANLIVGTAPDEKAAAVATGFEDAPAVLVVPDWVDPDAPASIEASCLELGVDQDDFYELETEFDPIPFDIEPGAGPSVQQRTFSRTELLAGQAFRVEATGCDIEGAESLDVSVVEGDDLTLRGRRELVGEGYGDAAADPMVADAIVSNATYGISFSVDDQDNVVLQEADEVPMDIPPGTYTAFVLCANGDGKALLYEPQRIEITGSAPTGEADITVPEDSRQATFAGASCDAADVRYRMDFEAVDSFDALFEAEGTPIARDLVARAEQAARAQVRTATDSGDVERVGSWAPGAGESTARILEDFLPDVISTDDQGTWSATQAATFDQGFASGYAMCGDALGDGFVYDPQVAIVDVQVEPVTPTTTPPPAPAPVAVPGTPTYTG